MANCQTFVTLLAKLEASVTKSVAEKPRPPKFISYLRVSSDKQGLRGLGIEAQRNAVSTYLRSLGRGDVLLAEYVEVESGRNANRPELLAAIAHSQTTGAILIIAKLDRLSRDAHFLTGLERAGVEFIACDLPNANRLTITILAAVAEHEREMISVRTKAALKIAAQRIAVSGQRKNPSIKRLGNPRGAAHLSGLGNEAATAAIQKKADAAASRLQATLIRIKATGITSKTGLAKALNEHGIPTPRGSQWDAKAVIRLETRLANLVQQDLTRCEGQGTGP